MVWQGQSIRKSTGARFKKAVGKRKHEMGREPALTHMGSTRKKQVVGYGGNLKTKLLRETAANIVDPLTGKASNVKIESVEVNSANRNYVRRNIMTKGAIVLTELGRAKITNRPGQDGLINGILMPE